MTCGAGMPAPPVSLPTMTLISLRVSGTLLQRAHKHGLLLQEDSPSVYLRFALVQQGTGDHIFPEVVLDDWGHERNRPDVYRWIYEEGGVFPRAEVFGYDLSGAAAQVFLRKIEIYYKLPCYAYPRKGTGVGEGHRLHTIFIPDPSHEGPPQNTEAPEALDWPLRHAAVTWQRAGPNLLQEAGWTSLRDN